MAVKIQGDKGAPTVTCSMSKSLGEADSCTDSVVDEPYACIDCGKVYESAPGVRYHYEHTECSGHECPKCGKDIYHTRRGMKLHHKEAHGESIAGTIVECSWCGGEKRVSLHDSREYEHHFCNHKCKGKWTGENVGGENHPLANRITRQCDNCGSDVTRKPSQFYEKVFCNYNCEGEWLSKHNVGENHPNWKGGVSPIVYGSGWQYAREDALERDGYACVICGATKEDKPNRIDVHHIRHVESFENNEDAHELDNLVTLCRSHHRQWEGLPVKPDIR